MRPALLALVALALSGLPASAQAPSPDPVPLDDEWEVGPPDNDAALRAGFMLIDWQKLPAVDSQACDKLDKDLLRPALARLGIAGPYAVNCASATVTGNRWPEVLLLVQGAHDGLNNPDDGEGHRLFAFSHAAGSTGYQLVMSTQAQAVGVKGGEIAAIQPEGFQRWRWNGRTFGKMP